MCLWNRYGNNSDNGNPYGNPQCMNDGQSIGGAYCMGGEWTSKTRIIASYLMSIADDEYSLYCDSYNRALNHLRYKAPNLRYITDYFIRDRVGEICVLESNEQLIFGVPLKQPVNTTTYPFLETISKPRNYCDTLSGDGEFKMCSDDAAVLYSPGLNALLFSNSAVPAMSSQISEFANVTQDEIMPVIQESKRLFGDRPYRYALLDHTRFYSKVFIEKKGEKKVRAVLEAPFSGGTQLLAAQFTGFSSDLCSRLADYDRRQNNVVMHINCSGGYVLTRDFYNENALGEEWEAEDIWQEITSKLRIWKRLFFCWHLRRFYLSEPLWHIRASAQILSCAGAIAVQHAGYQTEKALA